LENTRSNDLTDILCGGEYWPVPNRPADSAIWEYWLEAIDNLQKGLWLLNQVEFNSKKLGGKINFWGFDWVGIFVWIIYHLRFNPAAGSQ